MSFIIILSLYLSKHRHLDLEKDIMYCLFDIFKILKRSICCSLFFCVGILCFKTWALKTITGDLTRFHKTTVVSLVAKLACQAFHINSERKLSSTLHQSFKSLKLFLTKGRRIIITFYVEFLFKQSMFLYSVSYI